jgi:hypothetical protein
MQVFPPHPIAPDLGVFPVDYDERRDELLMLPVPAERIADAAFLDQRLGGDWTAAVRLGWREIAIAPVPPPAALLFHTAFCGSTLLARTLQLPPQVVALREPQVLNQLASAALRQPRSRIEGPLRAALGLLARPWVSEGRILIKPTNQANNLLPDLLRLTRGKAILLYSSLPEFVISCCKKLPEADRRVRWMAQHLIKDTRLQDALQVPWDHPFHFIESCVLTWYSQVERYAEALADDSEDRLRSLDMQAMLADPMAAVAAAAEWLELGIQASALQARVHEQFQRNAKHPERMFDAAQRAREREQVAARHADILEGAINWARDVVAPCARLPVDWKPLVSTRGD